MFQTDTRIDTELTKQLDSPLFNAASIRTALLLSLGYLALSYVLIGFKTDQLFLVFFFNALYFASRVTRRFIIGFSIFIIYWIVFDYMKAFPNYQYNEVSIASLYEAEKSLFGIDLGSTIVTPNEYFANMHSPAVDLMAGFFYLCWVPVPLLFAGIMFFRNRSIFFQFSLTFFLVNLIGFIGYYGYPAAPPWYVAQKGFEFIAHTPGNTAGLARFDALVGAPIFEGLYSKSSNVFAAMPSLHAAYMLIVVYYGIRAKLGWYNLLFAIILGGIWFTAVYSGHHYILDILAGVTSALLGIALFQFLLKRNPVKGLVEKLMSATEK